MGIEKIKHELKTQRDIIIEKGGKVVVKNDYPSPAEITEGINTIVTPDFSSATATEQDVVAGKTFFGNSSELKTGTGSFQAGALDCIFMANPEEQTIEERVYYTCPEGLKAIRASQFDSNINPISFTFNSDLMYIGEYAFYEARNMIFGGFNEMTKIQSVAQHAFTNTSGIGMNVAQAPSTIHTFGPFAFYKVFNEEFTDYKFPDKLTSLGASAYRQVTRKMVNSLDLTNYKMTTFSNYLFQHLAFNCDCVIPEGVKTVNISFNHNGCFRNIHIPSTVTKLDNYCFGSDSTDSLSNYYLQTVTFTRETPPTINLSIFAVQNIENGFKIYVPDTAIEEYKAVANLQQYVNCIYPISEKE